jgi:hypothetical protein
MRTLPLGSILYQSAPPVLESIFQDEMPKLPKRCNLGFVSKLAFSFFFKKLIATSVGVGGYGTMAIGTIKSSLLSKISSGITVLKCTGLTSSSDDEAEELSLLLLSQFVLSSYSTQHFFDLNTVTSSSVSTQSIVESVWF